MPGYTIGLCWTTLRTPVLWKTDDLGEVGALPRLAWTIAGVAEYTGMTPSRISLSSKPPSCLSTRRPADGRVGRGHIALLPWPATPKFR